MNNLLSPFNISMYFDGKGTRPIETWFKQWFKYGYERMR